MENQNYSLLYALQDRVLAIVFNEPLGFYLSGGTALSRFYLGHRYSDDLDFFTHDTGIFSDAFRLVLRKLRKQWSGLVLDTDGRDFKRVSLTEGGTKLKLDFISDRIPRIGIPILQNDIVVDTVRNILSNKITAILGRDEARDVADLIHIVRKRKFYWANVIDEAKEKEAFELADLLYRLRTFPVASLLSVPFLSPDALDLYSMNIARILIDLEIPGENSLAEPDAIPL